MLLNKIAVHPSGHGHLTVSTRCGRIFEEGCLVDTHRAVYSIAYSPSGELAIGTDKGVCIRGHMIPLLDSPVYHVMWLDRERPSLPPLPPSSAFGTERGKGCLR